MHDAALRGLGLEGLQLCLLVGDLGLQWGDLGFVGLGQLVTQGLALEPTGDYGHGAQMRNFHVDPAPQPGWSVDWRIEDCAGAEIHLRYTDLTANAQACTCEGWVDRGNLKTNEEAWIPCVLVRRQGKEGPLVSTFVSVIEPYEGRSKITRVRRLSLETFQGEAYPDSWVAVEIELNDGRRDLLVAIDVEDPLGLSPAGDRVMVQREWGLHLDGEICLIRRDAAGQIGRIALHRRAER